MLFVATLAVTAPAQAQSIDAQFRSWLEKDLWPDAKANGVSKKTFDAAFAGVTPNLKLPDLVMPGEKPKTPKKQLQAEFGSPGSSKVADQISQGADPALQAELEFGSEAAENAQLGSDMSTVRR